jgi:hypothetical protein
MRADPLMRWLHNARTQIDKRGDLDTSSTARVKVVAGWGEPFSMDLEMPPLVPPDAIAEWLGEDAPDRVRREGVLIVERRWVVDDLPDWELLDALAYCYGFLANVVRDAHALRGLSMRTFTDESHEQKPVRTEHLGGRLPCMVATEAARSARLHLARGELMSVEQESVVVGREHLGEMERAAKHYGVDPSLFEGASGDFLELARGWSEMAKRVLTTDKHHNTAAMLFSPSNEMQISSLTPEDHQEKYILMDELARDVELAGADKLIYVTEAWRAPITDDPALAAVRPSDRQARTEALLVTAAMADGRVRTFTTPFTRDGGEIVLSETVVEDQPYAPFLASVFRTWTRIAGQGPEAPER